MRSLTLLAIAWILLALATFAAVVRDTDVPRAAVALLAWTGGIATTAVIRALRAS